MSVPDNERRLRFEFGTKAETLEYLRPFVTRADILPSVHFPVSSWRDSRGEILARIRGEIEGPWVVRSAARVEDGGESSQAGRFLSCLNVTTDALEEAIERVASSLTGDPADHILVQAMLQGIAVSGVLTTHVLQDGAPFYVLNYDDESGKTDTITGGTGVNKTVLVHRTAGRLQIESARVARWVEMARELEFVCGDEQALDVEFAETHGGRLVVLQVRRLATAKSWSHDIGVRVSRAQRQVEAFFESRSRRRHGLLGRRTILGTMPDWNPAEILGVAPRPLATSLYRRLVTDDAWRVSRGEMGYRNPRGESLLVQIGGRPYIDVRNSFNSFLPRGLDDATGAKLVDAWIDRLDQMPELHDKVEFEVALTAADLDVERTLATRYPGLLSAAESSAFFAHLRALTRGCLVLGDGGTLARSLRRIETLHALQESRDPLGADGGGPADLLFRARLLLDECWELGTVPFAVAARHAFIAEAMLRSAIRIGALSPERVAALKRSIVTISGELAVDFAAALSGGQDGRAAFLSKYGHLRPGTYDILSRRYDARPDLFEGGRRAPAAARREEFAFLGDEARALEAALDAAGLGGIGAADLLAYVQSSVRAREFAKFVFSRHLSDALELLARFGERVGLDRDDVSHLEIAQLFRLLDNAPDGRSDLELRALADQGREAMTVTASLHLGYLIRDSRDIFVIPLHRGAPNFISSRKIEGDVYYLDSRALGDSALAGKIVCIESADPGYDWIFTRGIAGLVTKYGGANSHMAIRCAEFGLPAAIGCGEQTFERLVAGGRIELDCSARIVRVLHG